MDTNKDLKIDLQQEMNIDFITLHKMTFIYNAIDAGWSVKKKDDNYVFSKKHEGKQEVYLETYLQKFIESNFKSKK